ncbi:MAG: proprotein convertase P-domain-containing protein [Candidatus Solibacter sp.]
MRKLIVTLLAFVPLAFSQTQSFTYSYTGLPFPVYPDDWNTVSVIRLFVGRSIQISKVTASVQVQFSGVGDLNVFMWSPDGTRTRLLERNCGGLVNIETTFDDSASGKFADVCPQAGTGTFRGNEPLANWNNQNAYGYWRIGVENNGSSRTGLVTGFSITVTGTATGPPVIAPSSIISTSSFLSGLVAPGDQISIFGVNLGPSTGVRSDTNTTLPTSLSGTTVTFNGVAAPIYYVSDRVVSVQAPTSLATGAVAQIQVVNPSGSSLAVPQFASVANPGVFTYEVGGTGQAKAINQDGSANGDGSILSSDKPAPTGSIISVYATGLGAVTPAVSAGTPAPTNTLSTTVSPVTATIAGRDATVTFAGLAPGLIGVYQLNIIVPPSTPSGAVRLALYAGGIGSQTGVTLQVK